MAKQSGGMPKIDEDFMRELISQGVPAKRESQPDDAPQPGGETETAHEGRQTETVRVEKTTNRKRKGGSGDYRETYFQKVELADRQPFSYSNYLSKDNELPLYLTPYAGNGVVIGKVHFRNTAGQSDADGLGLRWFKPANTRDTAYRNGWPDGISVDFLGSKFISPTANLSPLAGKTLLGIAPPVTATLTLTDGGLTASLANQLTVNERNIVTVNDPDTGAPKLKVKFGKKGTFTGNWVNTPDAPPTPFEGVILQKTQNASGYFLGVPAGSPIGTPAQAGAVTIGTVVTP